MNKNDLDFYDPRDKDRDGLIDEHEKPLTYTDKTVREVILDGIKKQQRQDRKKSIFRTAKNVLTETANVILERMKILKWFKSRLKEPSSYKAISAAGGIVGVAISPELAKEIGLAVASVISLIMFVERERNEDGTKVN